MEQFSGPVLQGVMGGLLLLSAYFIFIHIPRAVRLALENVPNFPNGYPRHLGIASGLAVDLEGLQLAYCCYEGLSIRTKIFPASQLVQWAEEFDPEVNANGEIGQKNWRITVHTTDYDKPQFSIQFRQEAERQQCRVSLYLFSQACLQIGSKDVDGPASEKKVLPEERELAGMIAKHLSATGFSRQDGSLTRDKKKRRFVEACELISSDFEIICGCPRPKPGWKKIAGLSLEPFFLRTTTDPKGFGYSEDTVREYAAQFCDSPDK